MTDEQINKTISEGRRALKSELRGEIEALFKKERDVLTERFQLFINVGKWAGGGLAILFGLLGIKAWSDVRVNVEEYFKARIEKTYRLEDANSPLSRTIEQLIDRAVVNALYAQVQRERNEDTYNRRRMRDDSHQLSPGELERLLKIAKAPHTDNSLFEDALFVLNEQAKGEEQRQTVGRTLEALLAAKANSEHSWVASAERKRLAILHTFVGSEQIDLAATEILAQQASERLKFAALKRIRDDKYRASVPAIIKFIDSTEEDSARFEAFQTLAQLKPEHPRIKTFIADDLMRRTEKGDLLRCLKLAICLATNGEEGRFGLDETERRKKRRMLTDLALPLASKALQGGVIVEYTEDGFGEGLHARIMLGPSSSQSINIGRELYSSELAALLLEQAAKTSLPELGSCLHALSLNSGFFASRKQRVVFKAILDQTSRVTLASGTELRKETAKDGSITLVPVGEPSDDDFPRRNIQQQELPSREFIARWKTPTGQDVEDKLTRLEGVRFVIEADLPKERALDYW